MKTFKLFAGAAALLAMGTLASCSSDEPVNGSDIVGPNGEKSYLKVALATPGNNPFGRSASDMTDPVFENGTVQEAKIEKILFLFYDDKGQRVTSTVVTLSQTLPNNPNGDHDESAWEEVVEVNLAPGTNKSSIKSVIAFANPTNTRDQLVSTSELLKLERSGYGVNDNNVVNSQIAGEGTTFVMNNSVYYDNAGNRVIEQPIDASKFYTSKEEASGNPAVTIHIERIAAKVTATTSGATINPYVANEAQSLTFVPEKWALTGTEKETYLIKNLPATQPTGADWNWINSLVNYRTFWAQSVNYVVSNPAQFPLVGCQPKTTPTDYALNYLTYNDVKGVDGATAIGADATAAIGANYRYCLENTGREAKWNAWSQNPGNLYNPYAATTGVLLVGHYEVTTSDSQYREVTGMAATEKFENATAGDGFYLYRNVAYKKDKLMIAMIHGQGVVAMDDKGTMMTDAQNAAKFVIKHIENFNGELVNADRVGVELGTDIAGLYVRDAENNGWKAMTEEDRVSVNQELANYYNSLAVHYNGGKAFFYIPIEHYGKVTKDGVATVVNGTYGVVRNHVYQVTVNSISGRATGINDFNDPLIPNTPETDQYFIAASMRVLAWHVVTQGVDL